MQWGYKNTPNPRVSRELHAHVQSLEECVLPSTMDGHAASAQASAEVGSQLTQGGNFSKLFAG